MVDPSSHLPAQQLLAIIDLQNEIVRGGLDSEAVMELVVDRTRTLTGATACAIAIPDGDEMVQQVTSSTVPAHRGLRLPIDGSLAGLCLRRSEVLHCDDAATDIRLDPDLSLRLGARSLVCAPVRPEEQTIGVLTLLDPQPRAFGENEAALLELLAEVVAAHADQSREPPGEHHDTRTDPLTGLPNRRACEERLRGEIARSRRHGGQLALCVLDLDGFTRINETRGRPAGDRILMAVARRLSQLRDEDGVFRLGGDEFALILVGAGEEQAALVARRLTTGVWADPECAGIRLSLGIAVLQTGDDVPGLLARADERMCANKRAVRGAMAA